MLRVLIPGQAELRLEPVVLDLNGTLSDRGALIPDAVWRLERLGEDMQLVGGGQEKLEYLDRLGAMTCVAIGNGVNDVAMLKRAGIGIAVFGPEGTSFAAMAAADVVCRSVQEALDLLLSPLALAATLRP